MCIHQQSPRNTFLTGWTYTAGFQVENQTYSKPKGQSQATLALTSRTKRSRASAAPLATLGKWLPANPPSVCRVESHMPSASSLRAQNRFVSFGSVRC